MINVPNEARDGSPKGIQPLQFFNLAIGMIVGVGWIIVVGFWVDSAGPLGAALAFIAGTAIVIPVAICYARMAAEYPLTGGPIVYAKNEVGRGWGYLAGWLLFVNFTFVVTFEVISIAWVFNALVPGLEGPLLYSFAGSDIHLVHLVIGIGGNVLLGLVNARGGVHAARVQDWLTWTLIAAILLFGILALTRGDPANLTPLFQTNEFGAYFPGFLAVLITVPFFLTGFDAIAQGMAESGVPVTRRLVTKLYALAIIAAAFFYLIILLSVSVAAPREAFLNADLPAAEAFRYAVGSEWGAKLVLLGGLAGLLSTWNGCIFTAARALHGLAEQRLLWPVFARDSGGGVSKAAVLVVVIVSSLGGLLGRATILPLINSASVGFGIVFFIVSLCVYRFHRRSGGREDEGGVSRYGIPIFGMVSSLLIAGLAFWEPARGSTSIPLEWWLLLPLLAGGFVLWLLYARTNAAQPETPPLH